MNNSEPSYRGFIWEPSYKESYDRLVIMKASFAHDLEVALEWRLRREADLGMGNPVEGLEVAKLFGHPPLRAFWNVDDEGIHVWFIEQDPNAEGEPEDGDDV